MCVSQREARQHLPGAMLTQAVSPLSFLKSPMILMAIVSMGLIFGMPYLMENSRLIRHGVEVRMTNTLQWIRRQRPNLKRCRRRASWAPATPTRPNRFRTLISPRGWQARLLTLAVVGQARRRRLRSGVDVELLFALVFWYGSCRESRSRQRAAALGGWYVGC
jgi:hypothetical protein